MKNFLLFILIIITSLSQAQCGMKEMPLEDRIIIADLVIEGQVISQQTFETDSASMILTRNTIRVTKIFKNNQNTAPTTVDIITKGGVLGLKADKVTTALELNKNDTGIFTLSNYQNNTYQAVAGSQSFIRYSQPDFKAYSVLKQWEDIDTNLFNDIIAITGSSFQRKAAIDFNYSPESQKMSTPVITSVSPLNVDAGIGDVITILGSGFGATQGNGTIVFRNADDGGSFSVVPDNTQIEFWSDTEIRTQVPTSAGNGEIAVVEDTQNNDISTQSLAIGFNHTNFTFTLNDGTNDFNVVSEISHSGENGAGGYNFDYATTFASEADASATLDDIYQKWRCTTGVNFVRGPDLAAGDPANTDNPQTTGVDNINVVKFDGTDLPSGSSTLAFVLTRASGCIVNGNDVEAFVLEMDVVINDDINWHFRDGGASSTSLDQTEIDFESVMLHEIGHAQQLGHVIDPSKVMHFSIGSGIMSRIIDNADIEGGTYINNKSINIAPCGSPSMQLADCDYVYNNNEWSPFNPSGTFNPNSTITLQNGTAPISTITGTRDIIINNGATLSSTSNEEIAVFGNINNNGTASFNQLTFNGTTVQSINGNPISINEMDIASTATVNLNTQTNIIQRFNNDGGSINTNGNLVLKSTATQTAHVDSFEGTINGEVTVERHYPSRRAFRFISPSVNTTTTIFENWQENGTFTTGIGTHISGSTSGANGFDATSSGNPSLFIYDNTGINGWSSVLSTDTPADNLVAGNPYRLFVRGDRDPSLLTTTNFNSTTINTTGTLATGNTASNTLSNVSNQFSFTGNPYQAPVDMESVLTRTGSNLAPNYYVWDPNLNIRGAYVTINTVSNTSSNAGSPANKYAQPNQAFFVQTVTNGFASLTFTEEDKDLSQGNLAVNNVNATMQISALLKNNLDNSIVDGFNILFDSNYSNAINLNDAQKLNNLDESISVVQNNNLYSISSRSLPVHQEVLELNHTNYKTTSYNYSLTINGASLKVYLVDRYLNQRHELNNNATTQISFTVDPNSAGSVAVDRFSIEFSNVTLSSFDVENNLFNVYPNPSNGEFTIQLNQLEKATIEIYNMLGQSVYNGLLENGHSEIIKTSLYTGTYILKISQNGKTSAQKIIVQ